MIARIALAALAVGVVAAVRWFMTPDEEWEAEERAMWARGA